MGLSDCPDCWSTPCVCGEDYERMAPATFMDVFEAVNRVAPKILAVRCGRCEHPAGDHNKAPNKLGYRGCTRCRCILHVLSTEMTTNGDEPWPPVDTAKGS